MKKIFVLAVIAVLFSSKIAFAEINNPCLKVVGKMTAGKTLVTVYKLKRGQYTAKQVIMGFGVYSAAPFCLSEKDIETFCGEHGSMFTSNVIGIFLTRSAGRYPYTLVWAERFADGIHVYQDNHPVHGIGKHLRIIIPSV